MKNKETLLKEKEENLKRCIAKILGKEPYWEVYLIIDSIHFIDREVEMDSSSDLNVCTDIFTIKISNEKHSNIIKNERGIELLPIQDEPHRFLVKIKYKVR